jgi:hypothetical protein
VQTTLAQFNETQSTESFTLQNSKLLKVSLAGHTIQAKLGSMVAYQGDVRFEHAGSGGMARMLKKAVTGEGASLMKVSGSGEVFLADRAQDIHLIRLEGEKITVNAANLLAFDADIDWDIERVQGASGMMGGGLFNTSLRGTGWVAIISDGPPVLLDVTQAPTFADVPEDRHQAQDARRARVGRVGADGVRRPGLGARAAVRGARRRRARVGRGRRRPGQPARGLTPSGPAGVVGRSGGP